MKINTANNASMQGFFFIIIIYRSITEFHKIKVNVKPNVIIFPQGLAHLGV